MTSMPSDKPVVTVIVPVYNSRGVLESCLNSILGAMASFGKAELILIDNGSTDGSYEFLRDRHAGDARLLQQTRGTIASLRNCGAQIANGEFLCFIDSDCVISPRHLRNAMGVFNTVNPAATGCKCSLPSSATWVEETWQKLHARTRDGFINYLNSGNFIIKRDVFRKIGGFNENLVADEDADLGQRMEAAGFRTYECHELAAIHLRNPKNLRDFFWKEAWRGSSLLRRPEGMPVDKALAMTFAHMLMLAVGVSMVFLAGMPIPFRIGLALCLTFLVPAATVGYRFAALGKVYRPLRSVLLYFVWFSAKACAVCSQIVRLARKD